MNKGLVTALCLGLIAGYGIAKIPLEHPVPKPSGEGNLVGQIVLARTWSNGTNEETGLRVPYDVTGSYPGASVLLSPKKTKVVYTTWEMAKINLYVADIDGGNAKKIAQQEIPEGSGGLNVSSIHWTDDTHIAYIEGGSTCKEGCTASNPPKNEIFTYSVDVLTGEKTLVSTQIQ
jgi:hypothetical protein